MPQHVRDIMTAEPVTVEPQTPVKTVARIMRDEDIGAVLVTEKDRLRGLVTDRDLVVRALAAGADGQTSGTRPTGLYGVFGALGAFGVLLLDACRFLADLGLSRAFLLQPLGPVLLQRLDLVGREGLGDPAAREARDGDAQLR